MLGLRKGSRQPEYCLSDQIQLIILFKTNVTLHQNVIFKLV